jgi:branched-chain amino acid transport system permease protein
MELFAQDLVNGILAGGIFAVVALGFSLVWGIMNIINLAHGAFIMMGAYTSYVLFSTWHLDPFLSLPLAFALLYVFGYSVQRFVINYVVRAPLLTPFLLTFGLSLLIVNVVLFIFHGDTKGITTQYSGSSIAIGPVTIAWTKLWTLVAALIITAGMQAFLTNSRACACRISTRSCTAWARASRARPACSSVCRTAYSRRWATRSSSRRSSAACSAG